MPPGSIAKGKIRQHGRRGTQPDARILWCPAVNRLVQRRWRVSKMAIERIVAPLRSGALRERPLRTDVGGCMSRIGLDAADIRDLAAIQRRGQLSKVRLAEMVNLSPTAC